MKRIFYYLWIVCVIIGLPIIAYMITYVPALAFPMSEHINIIFLVPFIIIILLATPYWILKICMHVAHKIDPREKEMRIEDLPKDQNQLNP